MIYKNYSKLDQVRYYDDESFNHFYKIVLVGKLNMYTNKTYSFGPLAVTATTNLGTFLKS